MLDMDVVLGEWQGSILGFGGGCELVFVHSVLTVPAVSQREAPLALPLFHDQFHVIVLGFVPVP
jgi:hypothetical protein